MGRDKRQAVKRCLGGYERMYLRVRTNKGYAKGWCLLRLDLVLRLRRLILRRWLRSRLRLLLHRRLLRPVRQRGMLLHAGERCVGWEWVERGWRKAARSQHKYSTKTEVLSKNKSTAFRTVIHRFDSSG